MTHDIFFIANPPYRHTPSFGYPIPQTSKIVRFLLYGLLALVILAGLIVSIAYANAPFLGDGSRAVDHSLLQFIEKGGVPR